jgi:uncharacterized protein
MLKIIIDTNVFISSLIQHSYPFLIVDFAFLNNQVEICISDNLLKEYANVLNRKKFSKYPDFIVNAKILLSDIEKYAVKYFPDIRINLINDDSDNKILELAETSGADYLITGNTNHFTMKDYKATKIVSPKEFWETIINNYHD